jgi:DNA-binding response OmpR family regulator
MSGFLKLRWDRARAPGRAWQCATPSSVAIVTARCDDRFRTVTIVWASSHVMVTACPNAPRRRENPEMPRIAVIEDSPEVVALVCDELRQLAYEVRAAGDGETGMALCAKWQPDVVVLDVMLPVLNGIEVLRRLRATGFSAPVLLLTARDGEADRVAGLELGADDYVVKPFSLRELSARIAALLRRGPPLDGPPTAGSSHASEPGVLRLLDCELDPERQIVRVDGVLRTLSTREFALLRCLVHASGRVLTREWLLQQVWGREYDGEDRSVDTCVMRLRERLGRESAVAQAIEAVRGVGYRLHPRGP